MLRLGHRSHESPGLNREKLKMPLPGRAGDRNSAGSLAVSVSQNPDFKADRETDPPAVAIGREEVVSAGLNCKPMMCAMLYGHPDTKETLSDVETRASGGS